MESYDLNLFKCACLRLMLSLFLSKVSTQPCFFSSLSALVASFPEDSPFSAFSPAAQQQCIQLRDAWIRIRPKYFQGSADVINGFGHPWLLKEVSLVHCTADELTITKSVEKSSIANFSNEPGSVIYISSPILSPDFVLSVLASLMPVMVLMMLLCKPQSSVRCR